VQGASIRLLGRFELHLGGEAEVRLDIARAELLVTYLLLHRGAQPRRRLAFALWPDSSEAQAQTNLRKLLHTLRVRLPTIDRSLEITPRTIGWRAGAPVRVDVDEFEKLTAPAAGKRDRAGSERLAALRTAATLYRGDLLDGHDQAWLQPEQQRLRARYLDVLDELADLCAASGELAEAVAHAERRLRGDPLREASYRTLMRLHAENGDRARALGVYHECATVLENELGVAPATATRAAYAALLPRESSNRPDEPLAGAAALVGRTAERRQLVDVWRAGLAGRPQFVLLTGEAGVGKTRLAEDFRMWCARQGALVAEARCHAAEGPLVYGPVTAWLRSGALRPRLALLDRARRSELARLLPELLAEAPDTPKPEPLSADEQRRRLLDAVAAAVLSGRAPRLLVLDDVQHVDRETCRLLHYLLRREPTSHLVVVATARREEIDRDHPVQELVAGLHALDRCVEIELSRLDPAETALLARKLAGTPLDTRRLYAETEGNPFFVVEALRVGWTPDAPVSRRVQTVLEARLAQLSGPARELAEVAATIGREFRVDVLAAAAGADDKVLLDGLDELWRRRILREISTDVYGFSHDKIREVAALGVSPPRRALLHLRIAPALEQAHATDPGPVSAQIALHYARGGAARQAVTWYRRAAEAAQELHASGSAVDLLQQALRELLTLPPSHRRDTAELELRNAVLGPLASLAGYVSPAIEAHQREATRLTGALAVPPAPPLLRSLGMSALTGEDFPTTTRIGEQLQAAGERLHDDVLVVEGAYLLGMAAFWQTDFAGARTHLETAVDRYRAADVWTHLVRYGQDPKVACLSRLGNTLWFLGQAEAAVRARDAALEWAEQIRQPFSTSIGLLFAAVLALDMGDEAALRRHIAGLEALGPTAPPVQLTTIALRGYLSVLDNAATDGLQSIDQAIRDAGTQGPAPGVPAILARIRLAAAVATGDGVAALGAAGALVEMGGPARVWAPEARRVTAAFQGAAG
jgi:DNA-binding SARP family transcriptional activator